MSQSASHHHHHYDHDLKNQHLIDFHFIINNKKIKATILEIKTTTIIIVK